MAQSILAKPYPYDLRDLIDTGKFCTVTFIKRSTGELRKMTCRTGVKRHLQGGSKPYSSNAHGLITVFDLAKQAYRSIPLDGIQRITANGRTLDFVQ